MVNNTIKDRFYFEGVRIRILNFGLFKRGAAMALPGFGICVGKQGVHDVDLLKHEFGHILQYRKWGAKKFWCNVAMASLKAARFAHRHKFYTHLDYMSNWTEWSANYLSYQYFNGNFNTREYPIFPIRQSKNIRHLPGFAKDYNDFHHHWLKK